MSSKLVILLMASAILCAQTPYVNIDIPAPGAVVSGTVSMIGWALDNTSVIGTAINPGSLVVSLDGAPVGTATYGMYRSDVCAAFPGRPGCPNVGFTFNLNTAALSPGAHTITVSATDGDDPTPDTGSASVTVTVGGAVASSGTIWNGTTPPPLTLGRVGDFYLDTATVCLYGPMVSAGGWPANCTPLVGQAGLPGAVGQTGAEGPIGNQGLQGESIQGIPGSVGPVGEPGAQGIAGIAGLAGPAGINGINGINGVKGDTGAAVSIGLTGAT